MPPDDHGIGEDIREIKRDVKRIYAILHGNGRGGLVTRQALIEDRVARLESCKKSVTGRTWALVMLVIAAGLGAIVTYWLKT